MAYSATRRHAVILSSTASVGMSRARREIDATATRLNRMLVAQARAEKLTVVTRDPRIDRYGVPTLSA